MNNSRWWLYGMVYHTYTLPMMLMVVIEVHGIVPYCISLSREVRTINTYKKTSKKLSPYFPPPITFTLLATCNSAIITPFLLDNDERLPPRQPNGRSGRHRRPV